jgi:hypothetical protein
MERKAAMLVKKDMDLQSYILVMARLFFYGAYSFLFCTLLVNSLGLANTDWIYPGLLLGRISCLLLGASELCYGIYYKETLLYNRRTIKLWLLLLLTAGVCLFLQDYAWLVLLCFILCAKKEQADMLMKVSFCLGGFFFLLGFVFWQAGALPFTMTEACMQSGTLGVIFFFLQAYYLWAYASSLSWMALAGFGMLHFFAYWMSGHADIFLCSMAMAVLAFLSYKERSGRICSVLEWINVTIVPLYSFIALLALDGLGNKDAWYYPFFVWINRLFQNQFLLARYKMQTSGLHYISSLSEAQFMADGIILNSGYLHVLLRGGLVLLLFYIFMACSLTYKSQGQQVQLVVLFFVLLMACVQNTLMSCWMLPFLCLCFPHGLFKKRKKGSPYFVMDSI